MAGNATIRRVPGPNDQRLFEVAEVLLQLAEDCLGDQCYKITAVTPGEPAIPCDGLFVFLDPARPLSIQSDIAFDNTDDGGMVGQFTARFIIRLQRCCVLPQIQPDSKGWTMPAKDAYQTAARTVMRDALALWQCLICRREEVFGGNCETRVLLASSEKSDDACSVFQIPVEITLDSDCCAGDCE